MRAAATGHRPPGLHQLAPYSAANAERLFQFAVHHIRALGVTVGISGFALGWDTAWAAATLHCRLPLIACIVPSQCSTWPSASQRIYGDLLARASEVHMYGDGQWPAHDLQARNVGLVDRSDVMVSLYDGASGGGTMKCLGHARRVGRPEITLWDAWVAYRAQMDAMMLGCGVTP